MNKKISTLLASGLLTVGSLLNSANAQTASIELGKIDAKGTTFYYVRESGGNYLAAGEKVKVSDSYSYTELNEEVDTEASDENLWSFTKSTLNGKDVYKLTSKKTGAILAFGEKGAVNTFTIENQKLTVNDNGLVFGSTWSWGEATHATALTFCKVDSKPYTAEDLNATLGGRGFSLSFPDVKPLENVFDQPMKAFEVEEGDLDGVPAGIYFAVSYPKALAASEEFENKAQFDDCTFIAVSPTAHYGIHALPATNQVGFKFTTVKGKDLKTATADVKKEAIYVGNAAFEVSEKDPVNKPGQFSLGFSGSIYVKKDLSKDEQTSKTGVYVDAITSVGVTYVTTTAEETKAKLMFSASSLVKPLSLLKTDGPAVYTIKFVSGKSEVNSSESSEYAKYLGIAKCATSSSLDLAAQGPAYVSLATPQYQFIISAVTEETVTFMNRENGYFFTCKLYETDTKNVYDVRSSESDFCYFYLDADGKTQKEKEGVNFSGTTIELTAVTVDKFAGYADYSGEDLLTMKFSQKSTYISNDLFASAAKDGETWEVKAVKEGASKWELVKAEKLIEKTLDYVYNKSNKAEKKEKGDTIAIYKYAVKLYGEENVYLTNGSSVNVENVAEGTDPTYFVIRENKNGSIALIEAEDSYDDMITVNATYLTLDQNSAELKFAESIYEPGLITLTLEAEELGVSLEPVSRFASFQADLGGFISVNEKNEAVISAVGDTNANLTFWLDSADTDARIPSFFISRRVKDAAADTVKAENAERLYMYFAQDSLMRFDEGSASVVKNPAYQWPSGDTKVIFRPATLVNSDTLNTVVNGKEAVVAAEKDELANVLGGLDYFKYYILKDADSENYYIQSVAKVDGKTMYLRNLNGVLTFTNKPEEALLVALEDGQSTVANEDIEAASSIVVVGGNGTVTVQGAAGQNVKIVTVLGKAVANEVLASDNATIAAPAGVVFVTVGDETVKVAVK
ncbi:DUF6383 domain-containing protein [Parabacteroides sp.]